MAVGLCNACVSFTVLNFAFYGLHKDKLAASFLATACTMLFSFALNRSFVFTDNEYSGNKLVPFIVVTICGLLIVQNSIFALLLLALRGHESIFINLIYTLSTLHVSSNFIDVNLGNIMASLCVLLWNYNGYRLFVFNDNAKLSAVLDRVYDSFEA
jgi:putative flippase GtrA